MILKYLCSFNYNEFCDLIVGIMLCGKDYYQEWYTKLKVTLICNEMWDDICEQSEQLKDDKQLAILKSKDKNVYA